jgi:PAS domain S-box-containing protein
VKIRLLATLILFVTSIIGTLAFTAATLNTQGRGMDLINVTGKQRMLNQQHMKELLLATQGLQADYQTPRNTFNQTLDALMTDEQHSGISGKEMTEMLAATKKVMDEFSLKADQLIRLPARDATYHPKLHELLVLNNRVHDLSDQTVTSLTQHLAIRLANLIRWEMIAGLFVTLLGLFLTRQIWMANKRWDREAEEREKAEKLLSLQYTITRITSESRDIPTGISRILGTITHNYHWAFASYWEVDAEAQVIRCRQVGPASDPGLAAFAKATQDLTLAQGIGLPGHVWQTGSSLSISDVDTDQHFPRRPVAAKAGLHGAFGFPIQSELKLIGVIEIFSRHHEPFVDPDLLYTLSLLGQLIGQFIQRQRDHETIAESEARLGDILRFAHDGVVFVDEALCIQLFNKSAEDIFGYRQEEVLGRPLDNLLPWLPANNPNPTIGKRATRQEPGCEAPACLAWLIEHCSACPHAPDTDQRVGTTIQVRGRHKNGSMFPLEASISKISLKNQPAFTIFLRDITQRQKWEDTIQKTYQFTEEILTSISAILISVDNDGIIRRWSITAEHTFGLTASTVLGRPFTSCALPWDWAVVHTGVQQCVDTQAVVHIETLRYTTDCGSEGFLELTINPIRGTQDGDTSGFLILGTDISRKKQLEMQLGLAQKMESIGQLAAGIAHEINTPIQFVSDNLLFLKESFDSIQSVLKEYDHVIQTLAPGSCDSHLLQTVNTMAEEADLEYAMTEIPKALSQSLDGAKRVTNIVTAMKDFSHPGSREKCSIDLNKAIESTIVVARNEWKYVSEVITDFDPDLPPVPCLRGEFGQVILNLLVNATHAIADAIKENKGQKGIITVSTGSEGPWAEVRITDTGTGIPVESRNKIFDPFYTTKEVGLGTGQGLAIAHNVIVDKHGGSLTFDTTMGVGTTFLIRLPLHSTPAAEEVA